MLGNVYIKIKWLHFLYLIKFIIFHSCFLNCFKKLIVLYYFSNYLYDMLRDILDSRNIHKYKKLKRRKIF